MRLLENLVKKDGVEIDKFREMGESVKNKLTLRIGKRVILINKLESIQSLIMPNLLV